MIVVNYVSPHDELQHGWYENENGQTLGKKP